MDLRQGRPRSKQHAFIQTFYLREYEIDRSRGIITRKLSDDRTLLRALQHVIRELVYAGHRHTHSACTDAIASLEQVQHFREFLGMMPEATILSHTVDKLAKISAD